MPGCARPVQRQSLAVYQVDGTHLQADGLHIHHIGHVLHGIIPQKTLPPFLIGTVRNPVFYLCADIQNLAAVPVLLVSPVIGKAVTSCRIER